jgi:LytS/YehU family sensor histidine kinase
MKSYFIHNPLFRIVAPAVYGVLLYLLTLLINNNVSQVNDLFSSEEVYVFIGLSYLSFESIRIIIVVMNRIRDERIKRMRILFQALITSVTSVGIVIVCLRLYFEYRIGFSMSSTQFWIFSVIFTTTALLYNTLYFSNYFIQQENTLKLTSEKQQRQVLELEISEFRNDINPDLLYESMESIIGLMYRDVEKAEEFIDCLASTYRYVLANRQQELVPITAELEAARNLVRLLNEKYAGQLQFECMLEERDMDAMLIPGSLPLIIESLVRNTIITRFEPFVIRCYSEDDYITIQSKLNDRLLLHAANEHALSRLQKSYSLYSDLPLIKVKAYEENYIKLPVINVTEDIALT